MNKDQKTAIKAMLYAFDKYGAKDYAVQPIYLILKMILNIR